MFGVEQIVEFPKNSMEKKERERERERETKTEKGNVIVRSHRRVSTSPAQ